MRAVFVLIVAAIVAAGTAVAMTSPERSRGASPEQSRGAQSAPAKKAPATAPAPSQTAASITMPPVPNPGYAPGRPVETARAVYVFAAKHPEILKYVPCYCGCENDGHPHNESCFVKRRDAKGNVLEWDIHGYG
jgi:Protein of unknown function with PCYCGC motif